jgi:deferrochelatase/peroxidase EfeB
MGDSVDYADVQGIVRFAYKHLTEACYLLLTIKNAEAARSWLLHAPLAGAAERTPPPSTAMHVAFTAPGLIALGVPGTLVSQFSPEFVSGMAGSEARSRRLGDVGDNAPTAWKWGHSGSEPHVLVMLFAEAGQLGALQRSTELVALKEAFDLLLCLDTSDLHGVEPFGFTDGISQPSVDWLRRRDARVDQDRYGNIVALGEFLLGYPNEYGKYTERPLVGAGGLADDLPFAEDDPSKRDVGRNGTYIVVRDLRQDVRGFWQFVYRQGADVPLKREELAAAFVGRTMAGDPLVPVSVDAIDGIGEAPQAVQQNRFTFASDPDGVGCPFGAHIRRANPRDADFPSPPIGPIARLVQMLGFRKSAFRDDLLSSARFHRIVRRGREHGPGLALPDALAQTPPNDPERGLRFMCINANIARQFEFLQNAWLMNSAFNGLHGEGDPLLGNRESVPANGSASAFSLNREGRARYRVTEVPQFVTLGGGAYFFLPSLRALRYLARVGTEGTA